MPTLPERIAALFSGGRPLTPGEEEIREGGRCLIGRFPLDDQVRAEIASWYWEEYRRYLEFLLRLELFKKEIIKSLPQGRWTRVAVTLISVVELSILTACWRLYPSPTAEATPAPISTPFNPPPTATPEATLTPEATATSVFPEVGGGEYPGAVLAWLENHAEEIGTFVDALRDKGRISSLESPKILVIFDEENPENDERMVAGVASYDRLGMLLTLCLPPIDLEKSKAEGRLVFRPYSEAGEEHLEITLNAGGRLGEPRPARERRFAFAEVFPWGPTIVIIEKNTFVSGSDEIVAYINPETGQWEVVEPTPTPEPTATPTPRPTRTPPPQPPQEETPTAAPPTETPPTEAPVPTPENVSLNTICDLNGRCYERTPARTGNLEDGVVLGDGIVEYHPMNPDPKISGGWFIGGRVVEIRGNKIYLKGRGEDIIPAEILFDSPYFYARLQRRPPPFGVTYDVAWPPIRPVLGRDIRRGDYVIVNIDSCGSSGMNGRSPDENYALLIEAIKKGCVLRVVRVEIIQ